MPPEAETKSFAESTLIANAAGGRLQFGEFRDQTGGKWLMIVNLDRNKAVNADLALRQVSEVFQVNKQSGELETLDCDAQVCRAGAEGYHIVVPLAPADGILLRLE